MVRLVLWHRIVAIGDAKEERQKLLLWVDRVADRLTLAGGQFALGAGGTVVLLFETSALEAALDTALELLDESERYDPPIRCCIAASIGRVSEQSTRTGSQLMGSALDRAQLLANRGKAGDLVLAREAETAAETTYLLDRQVPTGSTTPRGRTVDRAHPRRSACRPAMSKLRPPEIPPGLRKPLSRLEELARSPEGVDRVVLRGPIGVGSIQWLEALSREQQASFVLRLLPPPAALEPLGSLRGALATLSDRRRQTIETLEPAARKSLNRMILGKPVNHDEAAHGLRSFLATAQGPRPWILADATTGMDPSSLAVLGNVLTDDGPPALFVARLPNDAQAPMALQEAGLLEEITLPRMHSRDAYHIAESILGEGTATEIIRRVAVLGAKSPLGVLEAARTLIGAADLIHNGQGFRWRTSPRSGMGTIPVESLIDERLGGLEVVPMRVLELLCVAPRKTPQSILREAASAEGITHQGLDDALRILVSDAFVVPGSLVELTSELVRSVVTQRTESNRLVALHGAVGRAYLKHFATDALFARATAGYYLGEGGDGAGGAEALLAAGQEAASRGFPRSALRLAAAAVQYDGSSQVGRDASKLSRLVASHQPRTQTPSQPPGPVPPRRLSHVAVRAFVKKDFDRIDQLVDTAIAEGRDRAAAERLRALAHLARGDMTSAIRSLGLSQQHEGDRRPSQARGALTRALLLLCAGEHQEAVRSALQTLAHARENANKTGEAASLLVLGDCFEALGREDDATAMRAAAKPPAKSLSPAASG